MASFMLSRETLFVLAALCLAHAGLAKGEDGCLRGEEVNLHCTPGNPIKTKQNSGPPGKNGGDGDALSS